MLAVRPYCHTDHYWQIYFDTNRVIRETFGAAGYPVPEQHFVIHNRSGSTWLTEKDQAGVYHKQGSNELVVGSDGQITVESGGLIEVKSGGPCGQVNAGGLVTDATGAVLRYVDNSWSALPSCWP